MLDRFHEVKGYRLPEVRLCYSIVLLSFSIAETFFRGFDLFSSTISNGEFDRNFLRPRNTILLVACGRMEFTRIGRILQAIVMLAYGIAASQFPWNMAKVITLLLMIAGGSVIFGAVFIMYASICFFTIEGLEFMNILTDGAREHGKYPLDVYGKSVLRFCTFLVLYALFQYYPFLYLIGRVNDWYYILLPVIGCVFVLPCMMFWRYGVRHYQSTGS